MFLNGKNGWAAMMNDSGCFALYSANSGNEWICSAELSAFRIIMCFLRIVTSIPFMRRMFFCFAYSLASAGKITLL